MCLIAALDYMGNYTTTHSTIWGLIWLMPIAMAIYPFTVTVYFCVNCFVISNTLRLMNNRVLKFSFTSSTNNGFSIHLRDLQKQHFTICQSIELLKDSFGLISLFEILFLFVSLTNTIMRIVLQCRYIHVHDLLMCASTMVSATINLIIICLSAETVRSEVGLFIIWSYIHQKQNVNICNFRHLI